MAQYRGTTVGQDGRFGDKDKDIIAKMKFPANFDVKVDMKKVNLNVMKVWITEKIFAFTKTDDEFLVDFLVNLLEADRYPDPRSIQVQLTGFMMRDTKTFMAELWTMLCSAQSNEHGVPAEMIEMKLLEIAARKQEQSNIVDTLKKRGLMDIDTSVPPEEFVANLQKENAKIKRESNRRSRSPRRRSRSPKRRSRSPRKRSASPVQSERKRSASPKRKSPRRRSRSPRRRSRSPRKRSRSPRRKSRSPRRKSRSPRRKSRSPRRKSRSPRKRSHSSEIKSSSRRKSRSSSRSKSPVSPKNASKSARRSRSDSRDRRHYRKRSKSPRSNRRSESRSRSRSRESSDNEAAKEAEEALNFEKMLREKALLGMKKKQSVDLQG